MLVDTTNYLIISISDSMQNNNSFFFESLVVFYFSSGWKEKYSPEKYLVLFPQCYFAL